VVPERGKLVLVIDFVFGVLGSIPASPFFHLDCVMLRVVAPKMEYLVLVVVLSHFGKKCLVVIAVLGTGK